LVQSLPVTVSDRFVGVELYSEGLVDLVRRKGAAQLLYKAGWVGGWTSQM